MQMIEIEPSGFRVKYPDSVVSVAARVPSPRWKQYESISPDAREMTCASDARESDGALEPKTRVFVATDVGANRNSDGEMYGVERNIVAVSGETTDVVNGVGAVTMTYPFLHPWLGSVWE